MWCYIHLKTTLVWFAVSCHSNQMTLLHSPYPMNFHFLFKMLRYREYRQKGKRQRGCLKKSMRQHSKNFVAIFSSQNRIFVTNQKKITHFLLTSTDHNHNKPTPLIISLHFIADFSLFVVFYDTDKVKYIVHRMVIDFPLVFLSSFLHFRIYVFDFEKNNTKLT